MTSRPNRHPIIRALIWTGIALLFGVLLLLTVVAAEWPDIASAGADVGALSAELYLHIGLGVLTLVCLPFVLIRDGRRIPRRQLHPQVLAAEKLREHLASGGRGGEEFLAADGSVESLQRRPGGWVPITIGLAGILFGTVSALGAPAAAIILVSLSARRSWTLDFVCLATAIASQAAAYVLTPQTVGSFELPLFLVNSTAFAVLVIIGVIRGSREQGFIDTAAQTLLRERSLQDRAICEVRRVIARDMHDSLSHHLSVIATYSGALSVRKDLDPEDVRTTARLIADSARRSGVELREVLTMLRSDDQGTVIDPDLDRLVAGRGETAELRYIEPLSAEVLRRCGALERTTIFRFVQEAITNAVKHAPGQKMSLRLSFDEASSTIVLVASNPHAGLAPAFRAGAQQLVTGSGLGLLGLRERMEAMGGDLTVTTTPEFTLRARLPVDASVITSGDGESAEAGAARPSTGSQVSGSRRSSDGSRSAGSQERTR